MFTLTDTVGNDLLRLVAIVPGLGIAHITVHPHQRQIHARLYPAQHPFDIGAVGILVVGTEESASVVGPPGDAGSLHTQSGYDLTTEGVPVVTHVATPQGRAVALYAWESATCQDHRLTASSHQSFVHGLVHQQGIDISNLFATPSAVVHPSPCQVVVLWLCGVLPPGIDARRQQSLLETLPIGGSSLWVKEVYPVRLRDIIAVVLHLVPQFRGLVDLRPHAEHQPHVHLVQTVRQCLGVGVVVLVKLHGVPAVLAPPLPVLHDHAQGNLLLLETVGRLENLLRRVEPFATVDIAQRPLRHHRTFACQFSVRGDDLVGGAGKHRIVHGCSHGRAQHRLVLHLIIIDGGLVVLRQFSRQRVAPLVQHHDLRGRRWQPEVLQVDHLHTVDT